VKKAVVVSMLVVALVMSAVMPMAAAEPGRQGALLYRPDMHRAEFASSLDEGGGLHAQGLPTVTPFWVDMVNGEYFPEGGEGIYVAVLDTGLLDLWPFFFGHASIKHEWGKGFSYDVYWDEVAQEEVWSELKTDRGFITGPLNSGHGTHVTSTIVGFNVNNAFVVEGVAPKATIIPVLCMDAWAVNASGEMRYYKGGSWEMVSAAINYVAELAKEHGIKIVINMSLGGGYSPMVKEAVDYAISKGVIVVASAGNNGYTGMGWPGALPQVISAGAGGWTEQWIGSGWWLNDVPEKLNTEDYWGNNWQMYLEDFSSRPNKDLGQKSFHLDVTTPGASIVGPYKGYFSTTVGYFYLWGTSMAAPHVAGIAALVLEKYPHLNQYQVEFILKNAAQGLPLAADGAWVYDPWYGLYHFEWFGNDYGAGWLTADRAISMADLLTRVRFRA
jgi:subtilisin family serine protease